MDQQGFRALTRTVIEAPSRRDVLRGLTGVGLGLGMLHAPAAGDAKKKRKRKKRNPKVTPNQYGCIDVGQPCRGDSNNCCSGICEGVAPRKGKPDRSRCVAHNTSICTPALNICTSGSESICNGSNVNTHCTLTTGNAGFCADFTKGAVTHCRVCTRDTDCQAEFGADVACVVFAGICESYCPGTGGTACMPAGD